MPNSGMDAIKIAYNQPKTITKVAVLNLIRLFKYIARVMANQRSTVMIVSVKIDRCPANTVRNPAVLQPKPE